METQLGDAITNGWPLGLGNMNSRIRVVAPPQRRLRRSSSSFSSLSSSNLDTESTASFFPDQSVSLGRLIGICPANTGKSLCQNAMNTTVAERSRHMATEPSRHDAQGLCAPLLHHVFAKMGRSSRY